MADGLSLRKTAPRLGFPLDKTSVATQISQFHSSPAAGRE